MWCNETYPSFFRRWSTNFHRWIFEVSPKCASGSQGVWRSGLAVSLQKTSFYASGLSEQEINTIQASTGMVNGTLSFKYLGVPLNSKKLSLANCEPLLHQVKNHLSSWAVKTLSFAGRLLLIKTIIAGITTFWCWAFILPKACIKKINSMCRFFIWKGNLEGHHSAKVAWETVTLTKDQGGLGVKDLLIWNRACSVRLIWIFFSEKTRFGQLGLKKWFSMVPCITTGQ